MYLHKEEDYLTKVLTRDEYRNFVWYMQEHYPDVTYLVEALDNTFKVVLYDTPLTFWEEVLEEIKTI